MYSGPPTCKANHYIGLRTVTASERDPASVIGRLQSCFWKLPWCLRTRWRKKLINAFSMFSYVQGRKYCHGIRISSLICHPKLINAFLMFSYVQRRKCCYGIRISSPICHPIEIDLIEWFVVPCECLKYFYNNLLGFLSYRFC